MPGDEPDTIADEGNGPAHSQDGTGRPEGSPEILGKDPLELLELLRSGSQNPLKAMLGAVGGSSQDNPQLAMLIDAIEAQRDDDAAERLREELREEIHAEQAEAVSELAAAARQTFAELELCRSRIESLAAALGACPHCFGSDPLCSTCGGEGIPGSRLPQPSEFERVRSALRQVAPPRPWPNGGARRSAPPSPNPQGAST
jgi:hypothetical protein